MKKLTGWYVKKSDESYKVFAEFTRNGFTIYKKPHNHKKYGKDRREQSKVNSELFLGRFIKENRR